MATIMDLPAVDVAFILVNYFSEAHTRRCIASIREKTQGVRYEIFVVDNHSGLDARALRVDFPGVRVFAASRNLGFGAANNAASAQASAKYFFFLNNDCALLNDAATVLANTFERDPRVGLCGAQLWDPAGRATISFDYFPTLHTRLFGVAPFRAFGRGRFPRKDGSVRTTQEVDLVSGAALFIDSALFRALGGFDPQFFLYCEEEDLAKRVWSAGRRVLLVPEARVEHVGGGSSRNTVSLKREFYISFFRFYRKHYGAWKTRVLTSWTAGQLAWRWAFRKDRSVWWELLQWMRRGAPESESLRYAQENADIREAHLFAPVVGVEEVT